VLEGRVGLVPSVWEGLVLGGVAVALEIEAAGVGWAERCWTGVEAWGVA
jgi:hypothetical protein